MMIWVIIYIFGVLLVGVSSALFVKESEVDISLRDILSLVFLTLLSWITVSMFLFIWLDDKCSKIIIKKEKTRKALESVIKWETGEPKRVGAYILSLKDGSIAIERYFPRVDKEFFKEYVIAWCHIGSIEPYKEKKNE